MFLSEPDVKGYITVEVRFSSCLSCLIATLFPSPMRHTRRLRQQLVQAVHCVAQGNLWISSNVLEAYVRHSITSLKTDNESPTGQGITQRESQVIELVKRRFSNKEIGAMLNVQESTVKFHLSNIFSKLQVNRRSELQDKGQVSEIWRKLIAS